MRVLALHGFLGQGSDWGLDLPADWIAPDLFTEDSEFPLESFQAANQYLNRRATEVDLGIGYSFGGRLLLSAICAEPDSWQRIAVIGAHPGPMSAAEREARLNQDYAWAAAVESESWSSWTEKWDAQAIFSGSLRRFREEHSFSRTRLSAALVNLSPAKQESALEQLTAVRDKILWMVGERDAKYLKLYQELKAKGVIRYLKILPAVGHRVPLSTALVNEAYQSWEE